ncbi:hypothetical protein Droror1_Dr00015931 [Drosera rotundifolia]
MSHPQPRVFPLLPAANPRRLVPLWLNCSALFPSFLSPFLRGEEAACPGRCRRGAAADGARRWNSVGALLLLGFFLAYCSLAALNCLCVKVNTEWTWASSWAFKMDRAADFVGPWNLLCWMFGLRCELQGLLSWSAGRPIQSK